MSASEKELQFPIELTLGTEPFIFVNSRSMALWAEADEQLWKATLPFLSQSDSVRSYLRSRMVLAGEYLAAAARGISEGKTPKETNFWKHAAVYTDGLTLPAESRIGKLARYRAATDPDGALGAILLSTTMHDEDGIRSTISNLADVLEKGRKALDELDLLNPPRASIKAELQDLRDEQNALRIQIKEAQEHLAAVREHLDKITLDLNQSLQKSADAIHDFPTQFQTEVDKATAQLSEISALDPKAKADAEAALKNIEAAYTTRSALTASTNYWRGKRAWHRWMSLIFGTVWIGGVIAFIFIAYLEAEPLYNKAFTNGELKALWPFAISILYVTLSVWILRAFSRLFLSSSHLSADAHERTVMNDALFSIAGDEKAAAALKERPMSKTLDILFRPANKGMIKDDGPLLDLNKIADAILTRASAAPKD